MKNFKLQSFDDTPIYIHLWDDVVNPRGVIQFSHGMGEHGGRFSHVAEFLNSHGFICFADDHRGHGLTETDEMRGHHQGDIFGDTVKDLVYFNKYFIEQYNLPIYFIGHSYGSFLGQSFLLQGTESKGVVLTGSAKFNRMLMLIGATTAFSFKLIGGRWRPKFIRVLSEGSIKKLFPPDDGDENTRWLTRDIAMRQVHVDDPLSGVNMSINFNYQLARGMFETCAPKNEKRLNPYCRILLLGGDKDPVSNFGETIPLLADYYKDAGVKDVIYKLYKDARHEVFNETNRQEVFEDLLKWLEKDFKEKE